MAFAHKDVHFTGTIGMITYYQWGDRTIARIKSSLTRERVLKDKKFAKTRKYAADLGIAAKIGSLIYKALPSDIRGRWIYRALTGEAASLLYRGKQEQEVKDFLWEKYIDITDCITEEVAATGVSTKPSTKKANKEFQSIFQSAWERQGKPIRYFKWAWARGKRFMPITIPRRSEYFQGLHHAVRLYQNLFIGDKSDIISW